MRFDIVRLCGAALQLGVGSALEKVERAADENACREVIRRRFVPEAEAADEIPLRVGDKVDWKVDSEFIILGVVGELRTEADAVDDAVLPPSSAEIEHMSGLERKEHLVLPEGLPAGAALADCGGRRTRQRTDHQRVPLFITSLICNAGRQRSPVAR